MLTLQLAMFAQFATSPVLQEISTQITTTSQAPYPNYSPPLSHHQTVYSRLIGQQCVKMHILMDLLN